MTKEEKVVIVGAGPAGLFAANSLKENFEVTIIEKENYIGGSGLHSDGKLNFHPKVGGDLTDFFSMSEAWDVMEEIKQTFMELGVPEVNINENGMEKLDRKSSSAGINFMKIEQTHVGSDHLPNVMQRYRKKLEKSGVKFKLNTKAENIVLNNQVEKIRTEKGEIEGDYFILGPGRSGSEWLRSLAKEHELGLEYNPIDVGVRVEVPNSVMDEIVEDYGIWDPKFHIRTPSYDDPVRTFCVSPKGYVVKENYGDTFGVNGHSMRDEESENTNFAFLVTIDLTEPLESTMDYGKRITQLANTLGGGKPLLQRIGDIRKGRRSTWDRIERSYVEPTLKDVTPGDLTMALPRRVVQDILEGLEMLDEVVPGVNSNSTLLYGPEVKFYAMRVSTEEYLRTKIPNLYVTGDGAGVSRGITGAAATGLVAAKDIKNNL